GERWRLEPDEPLRWEVRIVLAGAEAVEAAMVGLDRLYLSIVNAPEEVVVAGDPEAAAELVRRLGCQSVAAPFDQVLHCWPVESEQGELARVLSYPTRPGPGLPFYSGGDRLAPAQAGASRAGRLAALAGP